MTTYKGGLKREEEEGHRHCIDTHVIVTIYIGGPVHSHTV